MCPKRPKIGSRTASDTVSKLCSNTVRFSLKGCPKVARRTQSDALSDITSTCVRNVRKLVVGQHRTPVSELCSRRVRFSLKGCPKIASRTVPDTLSDITSTCVRNVRKLAVGHRVEVMLKHCPIFPQRVSEKSENRQPDSPGHIVRLYLDGCPINLKGCPKEGKMWPSRYFLLALLPFSPWL